MTISIIIPVYNEEDRLDKTFQAFMELQIPCGLKLEKVIFVDDGSSDATVAKIKNLSQRLISLGLKKSKIKNGLKDKIQIISYKKNRGKGYAVKRGMKLSSSDYTLFMDADISTHPNQLIKFIPYMKKNTPIIIGTRKNGKSTVVVHQPLHRELLGRGFTFISNFILNMKVSDFTCGFKVFSKQAKDTVFPKVSVNGWGFDAELLFLGRIFGFEFAEVPVVWNDDRRSKVNLVIDLPKSLFDLFYIRMINMLNLYNDNHIGQVKSAYSFLKTIRTFLF